MKDESPIRFRLCNLADKCIAPGGLRSLEKRKRLWPLINDVNSIVAKRIFASCADLDTTHKDYRTVYVDVERYNHNLTKKRFMIDENSLNDDEGITVDLEEFPKTLLHVIMGVLSANKKLSYYQGFHDIAAVLVLCVGPSDACAILKKWAVRHFSDFMEESMKMTLKKLDLVFKIIEKYDGRLYRFLVRSNVGSIFYLSWIITWFSHSVSSFGMACRIFDFLMATNKLMNVYLCAAVIISVRSQILKLPCECSHLHCFLTAVPNNLTDEDWESCIFNSVLLFELVEPCSLYPRRFGISRKAFMDMSRHFTRKWHIPGLSRALMRRKRIISSKFSRKSEKPGSKILLVIGSVALLGASIILYPYIKKIFWFS